MKRILFYCALTTLLASCAIPKPKDNSIPSMDYTQALKKDLGVASVEAPVAAAAVIPEANKFESPRTVFGQNDPYDAPRARLVEDKRPLAEANIDPKNAGTIQPVAATAQNNEPILVNDKNELTNEPSVGPNGTQKIAGVYEYRSSQPNSREYNGPLSFGDPGTSASLWHESRGSYDLFRDQRAFRPMDLITILVTESTQAQKQADTEVDQQSDVAAGISNLLGLEVSVPAKNKNITPGALIGATTKNDYKGQGSAQRQGTLTAQISAMVAEVLPSGILRIEGEKIVTLDGEQEVMKISGLVRPRDINSLNQVSSSQVADMRIDYFGEGTLGEVQSGGWLGRLVRKAWPF